MSRPPLPAENSLRPHLGAFCHPPPPQNLFRLLSRLENPWNFPYMTSSETAFNLEGRHPREVLLLVRFAPPPLQLCKAYNSLFWATSLPQSFYVRNVVRLET